jgi:hypothetical protein
MRPRLSKVLLGVLIASTLLYAACEKTSIGKINNDPDRYREKEVGVVGTVTDSYGVPFVGGAYEIDDGTGRIWVVSRNGAPRRGTRVGAKGRVHSGLTFGARTFGTVIEESDRRVK